MVKFTLSATVAALLFGYLGASAARNAYLRSQPPKEPGYLIEFIKL